VLFINSAIKRFVSSNLPDNELKDIMYEIDLLKQLRHENIVHFFGYEMSDHLDIVMEYCEGGSLRDTIQKYGPLAENLVSGYMHQVCGT
jgi:serine/threonine protein kinase